MGILQMLKLLMEYGQIPETVLSEYKPIVEIPTPELINYADKLEYDAKGKLIFNQIEVKKFNEIIENSQGIPFCLREGFYSKPDSGIPAPSHIDHKSISAQQALYQQLAVVKIDNDVGNGLFVVGEKVIPENTPIFYSGIIKKFNAKSCEYALDVYKMQTSREKTTTQISNLNAGGIARFVQHAPAQDRLDQEYYIFNEQIRKEVAVSNLSIKLINLGGINLTAYVTNRDIKPGEQLLVDLRIAYTSGEYLLFKNQFKLFNKKGYAITELYYSPVELPFDVPKHGLATLAIGKPQINDLLEAKKTLDVEIFEGVTQSLSPAAQQALLNFIYTDEFNSIFHKAVLNVEDWKKMIAWGMNPKIPYFEFTPTYPHMNEYVQQINLAAIKAFSANTKEGYEDAIKLWSWLILRELLKTPSNRNKANSNAWYWNLANAYFRYAEKVLPAESYAKEAIFLYEHVRSNFPEKASLCDERMKIIKAWQFGNENTNAIKLDVNPTSPQLKQ